jgi:antitoxin Phd
VRKEEFTMTVNTSNLVSITEANQNFSKVARLVDESGAAVILKNNVPRYVIMEFSEVEKRQTAPDEDVNEISKRLINRNLKAYKELAK